jgi:hypothetical protein
LESGLVRRMHKIAATDTPGETQSRGSTSRPGPGTRLVREWNGRVHTVEVGADTFMWNGCHYPSLSAVAAAITGARWSGPRFFGL